MSEYYGHAVHGDDCAALIQASPEISDAVKQAARAHPKLMRMGSVLRAGAFLMVPALTAIRNGNVANDPGIAERRLVIALAQLSHRATDGFFKPVYRELAPEYYDDEYAFSPSDIRILHDTVLYHTRKDMPLAKDHPIYDPWLFRHALPLTEGQSDSDARHFETLFGGRVTQELLGLHQLFEEGASTDRKLRSYIMALDPVYIDTARYTDAAAQPYLNMVQRYIIDANFYDPDDPYISHAVDIQNGADPDPARLAAAKAADRETLSQWGKTLADGVRFFEAAQAYIDKKISVETFEAEVLS